MYKKKVIHCFRVHTCDSIHSPPPASSFFKRNKKIYSQIKLDLFELFPALNVNITLCAFANEIYHKFYTHVAIMNFCFRKSTLKTFFSVLYKYHDTKRTTNKVFFLIFKLLVIWIKTWSDRKSFYFLIF